MSESASVKTSPRPPQKVVRCLHCKRYLFTVVVTMEPPTTGPMAEIRNFKCPKCKHESLVLLGVADTDGRDFKEKVEDEMRKQIGADS